LQKLFLKISTRIKDLQKNLPYLPRALVMVWNAAPGWAGASIALLVVQGLLPAATVSLTRLIVNQLTDVLASARAGQINPGELSTLLILAAIMAMLMLLGQGLNGISNWVSDNQQERVSIDINGLLQKHSNQVDYSFYETPTDYDRLHRARSEASYRPLALVENLTSQAQNTITLIAMAAILIPYGWWLPFVLLLSTLPALFIVIRNQRRRYAWEKKVTPDERRAWYYDWIQSTPESAAELRLLGLGGYFQESYRILRLYLFKEKRKILSQLIKDQFLAGVLGLIVAGACLAWLGWRALKGQATLGDLALFYQAFNQGQSLLRNLLSNAGQLYGNLLFLSNLFEFLDMPNIIIDPVEPKPMPDTENGIDVCFEGVTFSYPGSTRPVLQDFNLIIPGGKTVAIVGDNGAGKSTLIKLICRLYDPVKGRITWNGIDIRYLSLEGLRRKVTVLFQEPMHYQETVYNNIAYGDLNGSNIDLVTQATKQAGADGFISTLPSGYQSLLGKWFHEGTDLSVGEWQRIALSRAFLRKAPLLLLDEPTSAMDAWAEADWLGRTRNWSEGKTTLIITHRLTTAMHASLIMVMEAGKIIETGSHEELLNRSGRYAQAWHTQLGFKDKVL
jgi:ATP-binding cassette, subfamily B, bacterial